MNGEYMTNFYKRLAETAKGKKRKLGLTYRLCQVPCKKRHYVWLVLNKKKERRESILEVYCKPNAELTEVTNMMERLFLKFKHAIE
jgi:hypothetical protein